MDVLHIIPSMSIQAGGPPQSTYQLVKTLRAKDINVQIAVPDTLSETVISRENFICYSPKRNYNSFRRFLDNFSPDLVHIQGLWHPIVYAGVNFACRRNIPYLVSTRGMLYPSALQVSSFKKRIAWSLYQFRHLQKAAAIHATCRQEMMYDRSLGLQAPIAVIPNFILKEDRFPKPFFSGLRRVGFVGRLHPIKNIDVLLRAWAQTDTSGCQLVLVGDGEATYTATLKKMVAELHIDNILFTGFLNGNEKREMLATFDFLVLPSRSENFGMVVPEALSQGIPVITSHGTPWDEVVRYNCGWWIESSPEAFSGALKQALSLSLDERLAMGKRGKMLIDLNYSAEAMAGKMKSLYEYLLQRGTVPDFVTPVCK